MADDIERILSRFADAQFEAAGLRPDRRIRPAIVNYNLTGANALTALQTKSDTFYIGGSCPFICTELRFWSTGPVLINIKPNTMPEDFGFNAGHSNALFGPSAAPVALPLSRPYLLDNKGIIKIDLTDLSNAVNSLGLALIGFRTDV